MKEQIIVELGENYNENDDEVIDVLIEKITTIARSISNNDSEMLNPYIINCVKAEYLTRGGEGLNSINESGRSSTFGDNVAKMQQDIVKAGLRHCY